MRLDHRMSLTFINQTLDLQRVIIIVPELNQAALECQSPIWVLEPGGSSAVRILQQA